MELGSYLRKIIVFSELKIIICQMRHLRYQSLVLPIANGGLIPRARLEILNLCGLKFFKKLAI